MPSRLKTQYVSGMSDSPMWKRGNFVRSTTSTFRPAWARIAAVVEPAGPPPITTTSYCLSNSGIITAFTIDDDFEQFDRRLLVTVDRADPAVGGVAAVALA